MQKRILSTTEAADHIGVCPQTLRVMRQVGDGPPFLKDARRAKSHCKYRLEDLETWLAARTYTSTSEVRQAARELNEEG
jgi:hypothetical protein